MQGKKITILVVDDSPISRRTLSEILESSGFAEKVWTARDGEEGLKKALELKPDLITLDLEMPNMDGFTFLRILMKSFPIPVLVVSGFKHDKAVFQAMDMGAVDFLAKPGPELNTDLYDIKEDLLNKIRMVDQLQVQKLAQRMDTMRSEQPVKTEIVKPASVKISGDTASDKAKLVLIGSSTGGPSALQDIFTKLPGDLDAPIAISQHMPAGFTHAFSERLNKCSQLTVREAVQGEKLKPGEALVAPGGYHMSLQGGPDNLMVKLDKRSSTDKYVPSVDKLFETGAEIEGPSVLGVVLTGMGSDGRDGAVAIKKAKGQVIAESEKTAIVYGMPREAVLAGAVDNIFDLDRIADAIVARCAKPRKKSYSG